MESGAAFWQDKTLAELTLAEWEALCDGCGKCCLHKLEDTATGALLHTNVACRLLDLGSGRCSRYAMRLRWVPDCVQLTPSLVEDLRWLPATCAYRLRAQGQALPDWHPLLTGDPESAQRAGMGVRGRVIPERRARHLEQHIVEWQ
jgi:uncharacterized cysteine cluster protein YcgN (CxxCxxCC family)